MRWILTRYLPDWGPIAVRLALGAVFMAHGWDKLSGLPATAEALSVEAWGWPLPPFWAWLVALVETFAGLFVMVGLLTRVAATLFVGLMVVVIANTGFARGLVGGFELKFMLLMAALSLVLSGPGRFSVDRDVLGWGAPPPGEPATAGSDR